MKKKKKQREEEFDEGGLPVEGLWISSSGKRVEVIEHLLAIFEHPELFDLPQMATFPGVEVLRDIALEMIAEGWTRYRYLSGVHAFEVDRAKTRLGLIEDVLVSVGAQPFEAVAISQFKPKKEYDATVAEVFDRTILGYQENPKKNTWRFS